MFLVSFLLEDIIASLFENSWALKFELFELLFAVFISDCVQVEVENPRLSKSPPQLLYQQVTEHRHSSQAIITLIENDSEKNNDGITLFLAV